MKREKKIKFISFADIQNVLPILKQIARAEQRSVSFIVRRAVMRDLEGNSKKEASCLKKKEQC